MAGSTATLKPEDLWQPGQGLTPRLQALRDEYFSYYERPFKNEVIPYTTGTAWDDVYSYHSWTVVPETYPYLPAFRDSLRAAARRVRLPNNFWDQPLIMRRAMFFRSVLENHLPVDILDNELIAGGQFNTAFSKCLNKKEARVWARKMDRFFLLAKDLDAAGIGNCGATSGHLIPDYPMVLKKGFSGLVEDYEAMLAKATSSQHKTLLHSLIECARGVKTLSERYADRASAMAEQESDAQRKAELEQIAANCRKTPWQPPETFHEALQALWFTHMLVMTAESYPGAGLSHGRIDQYMYPYFKKDMESGTLTYEQAFDLVGSYFIKHNYAYDFQGRVGNNQGINSSFGQLITLGGHGPDGEDASNDLTWLMLDVIEHLNMLEPKPNVRVHAKTPKKLLVRLAEMLSKAQGAPFLLNFDSASIRALKWIGLPEDRLWDYAPVGCLENTLQGDDRSNTVNVNLNLAKAIELTMHQGRDTITDKQVGPKTQDPRTFKSFDELWSAFEKQMTYMVEAMIDAYNSSEGLRSRFEPTPYLSMFVGGCARSGKDINEGGARYRFVTIEGIGLATAADSLSSLKTLVFDEKRLDMDKVMSALEADFEGHEVTRQLLMNKSPKYGNDNPEADDMARRVSALWSEMLPKYKTPSTDATYRAGYLSWNYWIAYAPRTAATPDGRRLGEPLGNGICPGDGRDTQGPTALINSVHKLGLHNIPNGASHTVSLSPSLVRDKEHVEKLAALLQAYERAGGTALQVNIVDPETLIAAKKDPSKYRNLLVRVTGYNAYFVTLGKEIQDEIIKRESHSLR